MIEKDVLLKMGRYEQPYQQEKDYLQELFLGGIYSSFDDSLVFKGGTALSKFYGSGRFSDDLDFTAALSKMDPKDMESRIGKIVEMEGRSYPTKVLRKSLKREMMTYELSVRGPLFGTIGKYQHLKIETAIHASVIEKPLAFRINPPYPDLPPYVAAVMQEVEILAEKVVVLLFRQTPKARDLYDICFLIRKGVEVRVSLVDRKMQEYGHVFSGQQLDRRMDAIGKIWGKELERLIPKKGFIAYGEARKTVMDGFREAGLV